MKFGYIRVSTRNQATDGNSIEAQKNLLLACGITEDNIFIDIKSGASIDRPQLKTLMNKLESNDMLVVTKLDRIARSVLDGSKLLKQLQDKHIILNVLNFGIFDDSNPTGKLMISIMFSFAEFERDLIKQRTFEGKAIAKQKSTYKEGRPKKFSENKLNAAIEMLNNGKSYKEVSQLLNISISTLTRYKRKKHDCNL